MYDTFKLHLNLPWSMSTDTMYIVAALKSYRNKMNLRFTFKHLHLVTKLSLGYDATRVVELNIN